MRLRYVAVIFLLFIISASATTKAQTGDPLNSRVTLVVNRATIHKLLGILSLQTSVPIGFEETTAGDGSGAKLIDIAIRRESLKHALNAIVRADNRYEWATVDGVINVLPKQREQCICDVVLSNFSVRDLPLGDVGFAIMETPEIKAKMTELGLIDTHFKERGDDPPLRAKIAISRTNSTVREILNNLLKAGYVRYWAIVRYGDAKEYIAIVVS